MISVIQPGLNLCDECCLIRMPEIIIDVWLFRLIQNYVADVYSAIAQTCHFILFSS